VIDQPVASHAGVWDEIYERADVSSVIHQHRLQPALKLVDDIRHSTYSCVLVIGCGAGVAGLELARRGFVVEEPREVCWVVDLPHDGTGSSTCVGLRAILGASVAGVVDRPLTDGAVAGRHRCRASRASRSLRAATPTVALARSAAAIPRRPVARRLDSSWAGTRACKADAWRRASSLCRDTA
jgi:hypothetical protein